MLGGVNAQGIHALYLKWGFPLVDFLSQQTAAVLSCRDINIKRSFSTDLCS